MSGIENKIQRGICWLGFSS